MAFIDSWYNALTGGSDAGIGDTLYSLSSTCFRIGDQPIALVRDSDAPYTLSMMYIPSKEVISTWTPTAKTYGRMALNTTSGVFFVRVDGVDCDLVLINSDLTVTKKTDLATVPAGDNSYFAMAYDLDDTIYIIWCRTDTFLYTFYKYVISTETLTTLDTETFALQFPYGASCVAGDAELYFATTRLATAGYRKSIHTVTGAHTAIETHNNTLVSCGYKGFWTAASYPAAGTCVIYNNDKTKEWDIFGVLGGTLANFRTEIIILDDSEDPIRCLFKPIGGFNAVYPLELYADESVSQPMGTDAITDFTMFGSFWGSRSTGNFLAPDYDYLTANNWRRHFYTFSADFLDHSYVAPFNFKGAAEIL